MAPAISDKHIIISGAGLSGLIFAHAIDRFWPDKNGKPSITVYERGQQHVNPEREGYSIGIRSDPSSSGMQALQELGMLAELLPKSLTGLSGPQGAINIWDLSWRPLMRKEVSATPPDGLPVSHTRFFRPHLLQHLRESLPAWVKVQWQTQCVSAAKLKDDRVEVLLDDNTTAQCDLLVAADGANSKLRHSILPHDKLSYAGAIFLLGQSNFPQGVPQTIKNDWGLVIGGGGSALFAAPIDGKSAAWSVSYRSPEPRAKTSSFQDTLEEKQALLDEARRRGTHFQDPFTQLMDNTALQSVRVLNAMDKQPVQNHKLDMPVVFIGDASHAVSPFAGNGANMAIMDGVNLAKELCKSSVIKDAIADFDKKSSPPARKSVTMSHIMIRMAHSTGWQLTLWLILLRIIMWFTGSK